MVTKKQTQKWSRFAVASVLLLAAFLPILNRARASAYALPTDRYIQMSSSANGTAPDGSGDDVVYQVGFVTNQGGASSNIGGLVIEFCSDSPIIGDTCTTPAGFDVNEGTLALANQVGITGFAIDAATDANTLILTRTASSIATALTVSIDLGTGSSDGITNPSTTNTTFYARILTFDTTVGAQQYTSANIDNSGANNVIDAGGVALSTAAQITITAKVPERITFCVFTDDDSTAPNSCGTGAGATGDLGGTAVTLGDTNGVLDFTGPYVDTDAQYSVATNASSDVAIRAQGTTLKLSPACADGTGQVCSIDPIGAGLAEAVSASGSEQFGFCSYASAGAGGLTIDADYDGDNGGGEDCSDTTDTSGPNGVPGDTTGGNGVGGFVTFGFIEADMTSTYGDQFATKAAGLFSTGRLAFIGNIALVTEPGIYTSTLTFIATGTY